jgi:hypothetical protein
MKKTLLFITLLSFSLTSYAQIIDSDDFNSLTIGNFATDITGATAGQGGFFILANNGDDPTTTTNADASNLQVVSSGNNGTQGAQLTTPDGDKGVRFLFKPIDTEWTGRTSGNDIVELEFSFFTGAATTSRAPFRATVFGLNAGAAASLVALQFNPVTNELLGLATLTNNGATGFFSFNLGPNNTDLILPANTWFDMGCSYNTVTGELRWKTSFNDTSASFSAAANVITGMVPIEIDFLSFGTAAAAGPPAVPANAAAADYLFDDYRTKASASDTLLNLEDVELESTNVRLFPNPANDLITLQSDVFIKEVSIFNSLGQVVLTKTSNFSATNEFDISALKSGIYIMNIKSSGNTIQTHKFIKN